MSMSKRVALFGFRGAGKTSYLTMLFHKFYVNQEGRDIEIDVGDEDTRNYFRSYITVMRKAIRGELDDPNGLIPPTVERKDIVFRVREKNSSWVDFRIVDYRGEDVENLSSDVINIFKESDQIVAMIDSRRYIDEPEYRYDTVKVFSRLLDRLKKPSGFPLTILLTKYDLSRGEYADFEVYRSALLADFESMLRKKGYENFEFLPISCFRVEEDRVVPEGENLEESLLLIIRKLGIKEEVEEAEEVEELDEEEETEGGEVEEELVEKAASDARRKFFVIGALGVVGIALVFIFVFTKLLSGPDSASSLSQAQQQELEVYLSEFKEIESKYNEVLKSRTVSESTVSDLIRDAESLRDSLNRFGVNVKQSRKVLGDLNEYIANLRSILKKAEEYRREADRLNSEWRGMERSARIYRDGMKLAGEVERLLDSIRKERVKLDLVSKIAGDLEDMHKKLWDELGGYVSIVERYNELGNVEPGLFSGSLLKELKDDMEKFLAKARRTKVNGDFKEIKEIKEIEEAYYFLNIALTTGIVVTIKKVEYLIKDDYNVRAIYEQMGEGPPDVYLDGDSNNIKSDSFRGVLEGNWAYKWSANSPIIISFYDKDTFDKDDFLGSVFIKSLKELLSLSRGNWFNIFNKSIEVGMARFELRDPIPYKPINIR